jgi:uncharacterized damage-inducible protein DinB
MKLLRLTLLALALPLAAEAQQPAPSGPPTDPMVTAFRGRIMNGHRNLAQAFDSIPADKFGFKPTPAQQTIGYVAQHLANDNYFFCNDFGDMKHSRPAEETSTPDSVKATWPKEKLVASLKASIAFCEQAIAQLNDGALDDMLTIGTAPNTRQLVRVARVLGHAMDLQDHYSQIANYMRLNGMLPPTALGRQMRP